MTDYDEPPRDSLGRKLAEFEGDRDEIHAFVQTYREAGLPDHQENRWSAQLARLAVLHEFPLG